MPSHALKSILKPTRAGFLVDSRGEVTVVEREQRPRKRVSFAVPEIEVKANEEEPTRPLSKATEIQNSKKRKAAKELQAQSTSTAHPTAKKTAPKVTLEDALQLWMSLKRWHSSGTKHFAVNTESTAKAFKDSSQELASLVKRLCELWKDSADSTAKHTLRNVIHRLDDALKETRSRARWSSSRIAAVVNAARDLAAVLRPYGDGKKHPLSNVSTKDTEEHRVFEPSSKYIRQICYAITQEIRATTETKDKPVKKRKTSHGTGQEKAPILVD